MPEQDPISETPPANFSNFWKSLTLEELAEAQGVKPIADVRSLFGTWPGKENDGFEESTDELRHPSKSSLTISSKA